MNYIRAGRCYMGPVSFEAPGDAYTIQSNEFGGFIVAEELSHSLGLLNDKHSWRMILGVENAKRVNSKAIKKELLAMTDPLDPPLYQTEVDSITVGKLNGFKYTFCQRSGWHFCFMRFPLPCDEEGCLLNIEVSGIFDCTPAFTDFCRVLDLPMVRKLFDSLIVEP